ncbi:MAG TPA: T9SS type A sorting domain-containing protein [Phnomibacter sp.]|nr:T9SS type A sorting domain-containing protein [Phnomibacter sp.]
MKPFYFLQSRLRLLFVAFFALVAPSLFMKAGAQKAFTKRTVGNYSPTNGSYRIKGDFTMIGNTNLTLSNYTVNGTNNQAMVYVNTGANNNTTLNSSTADLRFNSENGSVPSCSKVLFAGIYWCGRSNDGSQASTSFNVTKGSLTKTLDKRKILLKGPAASGYTQITASTSDIMYPNNEYENIFVGFSDITDYVKTNGVGTYTVADIALREGTSTDLVGFHGGWSMVVIYENPLMNWRDVTLYDGYQYRFGDGINTGGAFSTTELKIDGFQSVATGNVNVKVGMMASEGERGWLRDEFQVDDAAAGANWIRLRYDPSSNSVNDYTNFFTSSIQTGGNTRNPNLVNNTGLDVLMFNLPNSNNSIIANNQTSTTFRLGTGADSYVLFNLAFSVDAYVPEVQNALAVTGASITSAVPGQEIEYSIDIYNKGTEAVNNYKMVIPIPAFAEFSAGSLTKTLNFTSPVPTPNNLYFDPALGPTGSIVYDFGTLPKASSVTPAKVAADVLANFKFKLKVTTNCAVLRNTQCPPQVSLNGGASGTGATSGTSFANIPFITGNGTGTCGSTPVTDPLRISIDASSYQTCGQAGEYDAQNRRVFNHCPATPSTTVDINVVKPTFPTNTRFFASASLTSQEYTTTLPAVLGNQVFYALPPGFGACYIPFVINSCSITQPLTGNIWIDKNGDKTVNAGETIPPTTMYKVMAVAANGPNNGKQLAVGSFNTSGVFNITVPANPVFEGGLAVAPLFDLALIRSELDPGMGAAAPIPAGGMMGTAPSTGGEFYVTNPSTSSTNPGVFNIAGVYKNITPSANFATITNLNIGIQSRPVTDPVYTALPGRPIGTFWELDNDDQLLSGSDAEDGIFETGSGKTFRILSNPKVVSGITIKLAYDANGNGPDAGDVINASTDPADNIYVDIPNYNRNRLFVYFQSGLGSYTGSFTYTAVDAAGAVSATEAIYNFTAILPLNGLELSGSYSNAKGNLRWTATAVEDVDHFILERSASANGFKQVTVVQAHGKDYTFVDDLQSFVGKDAYYRVKMVRKNGSVSYSNIISLKLAAISGIQLMPTAVNTDLQVRFNNQKHQPVNIRVINMAGQVVMSNTSQAAVGNTSINLSGFERMPAGTYNVQVFAGNQIQQGKIVVQH